MKIGNWELRKFTEKRDSEPEEVTPSFGESLSFGSWIDPNASAMKLSAVYRATEIISDSIAMLPISVKSNKGESVPHPLLSVFDDGIKLLDKYEFMKMLIQSVILKGNGFAYINRSTGGDVIGLQFLKNSDVTINYNDSKGTLDYTCSKVSNKRIPKENMIHLVKNSWDGINGVSVLSFASRLIDTANNTENSAKSFFSNGMNLAGIITVQGTLTEKQRQDIRNNWARTYNGTATGGCCLGVMQGNMSYTPIQVSSADAQMLESRHFNVQDIARFFGISPVLLGEFTGASYSTLEFMQNEFVMHTLMPYIRMVEDEFSRKLLKDKSLFIDLNETYLLRADKTAEADYYSKMISSGVMSIDEVRAALGMNEIGLTDHVMPYTDISQNKLGEKEEKKEDGE